MKLIFIICMLFFHKIKSQTYSCDDSKLAAVTNLVCNSDTNYNVNAVRGKKGPKGDKGEPGNSCDVIEKIETLDRENKMLNQQLSTLQQAHDDLVTKINGTVFGYTFKITPNRGNFDDCRKQCQQLGGDLIQYNFGANGFMYHSMLRKMMETSGKNLWIGMTDRETEGTWKYLNGDIVRAHENQGEELLYYFKGAEPNGDGDCPHYVPQLIKHYHNALNDCPCNTVTNLWGRGIDFHGLCEIKNVLLV